MKVKINNNGMTLMELLIVIAIIVILASMIFMATRGGWIDANTKLTKSTISLLDSAIEDYREYTGSFPKQDLINLTYFDGNPDEQLRKQHNASLYVQIGIVPDSKKILERITDSQIIQVDKDIEFSYMGMTYKQKIYLEFIDAWKTPLNYLYEDGMNFPQIISAGPDKDFAKTDDNITNRK